MSCERKCPCAHGNKSKIKNRLFHMKTNPQGHSRFHTIRTIICCFQYSFSAKAMGKLIGLVDSGVIHLEACSHSSYRMGVASRQHSHQSSNVQRQRQTSQSLRSISTCQQPCTHCTHPWYKMAQISCIYCCTCIYNRRTCQSNGDHQLCHVGLCR